MHNQILQLAVSFLEQEPTAAARLLEEIDASETALFLEKIPAGVSVNVVKSMLPSHLGPVFAKLEEKTASTLLSELSANQIAAVMRHISRDRQSALLQKLSIKKRSTASLLLSYNEDMIGAWVETDIPVLPHDINVEDGIRRLRKKIWKNSADIFLVDKHRMLFGSVALLRLLRATPTSSVASLTQREHVQLSGRLRVDAAMKHPVWDSRDTVPIVSSTGELVGVLRYRALRLAIKPPSVVMPHGAGIVSEILNAYGGSMKALTDVISGGGRQ